ncbi:hypothetical protein [Bacillus paranthracis]|uniref:hypothetical protein n=1 Tax=Bacillus paranthracis TaxID=2026186 RepID=UPI00220D99A0|nr:hypothetical protein [Bacillus paranthracis]UXR28937.1 hypothetical protein [Bacillus phage Nachito]
MSVSRVLSGNYQARVYLGNGKYMAVGVFPTKKEAQEAHDLVKAGEVPVDHFKQRKRFGRGNVYVGEMRAGQPYFKAEWRGKYVAGGYDKDIVMGMLDRHVDKTIKKEMESVEV